MAYLTRAKWITCATLVQGDNTQIIFASPTFAGAYRIALFEQGIANPNLTERQARLESSRSGWVEVWDKDRYPYREAALWEQGGKLVRFNQVQIKKHK